MVYFPPANSHSLWNSVSNTLRDANTRSWILLNPTSLGDTWIVCALAKAFRETHGPITMVVKESHAAIAQMYQNDIFKIIAVDGNQIQDYCSRTHHFCTFAIDQPFVAHPFWVGDGRLDRMFELFRYPGRGGLSFADMFRYMLHLDWDAPLARPVIPKAWRDEADSYAQSIGMVPGKSVILFPDNNTTEALPTEFWQSLTEHLTKAGWKVFTNMFGNAKGMREAPIEGTSAMTVPIHLAIPLVEIAGRYISGVNGISAMMVGCHANSQFTHLITCRAPGKEHSHNGTLITDPVSLYSYKYSWISGGTPVREYVVCPDEDMSSIIQDIADDNPATALPSSY